MVTYRLISKDENNNKKIVLEKHKLSEMDSFIYNSFQSEFELSKHFEIENGKFYITYIYQNNPKILDIILKDNNREFSFLLHNLSKNNVDVNSVSFRTLINKLIDNTSLSQIEFLYKNNYIDKYTYNDLIGIKTNNKNGLDYVRDTAELFGYLKQDLKKYINFRKLYSGIIAYNHHEKRIYSDEKIIANTDNELVNSSFNNGGYDELYSCFDLDQLYKLDGIEELGIGDKKNRR